MNRPWKIWLVFGLCFAVLLAAMGWVSLTTLRLDRAQAQAGQQAAVEEKVRLALWRMDSSLAPLIVEESARPPTAYSAFHAAERAYTKGGAPLKQGDVLVPSPLLTFASSNVLLHFQFWPDGALTSPQVPAGPQRELAEFGYATREQIELAAVRLARLEKVLNEQAPAPAAATIAPPARPASRAVSPVVVLRNGDVLINQCAPLRTNAVDQVVVPAFTQMAQAPQTKQSRQSAESQAFLNSAEWNARANVYQQVQQQALANNLKAAAANTLAPVAPAAAEGPLRALWLGGELLLARRVNLEGRFVVQGCWLNWGNLKQSLLAGVKDLLPAAELQPMPDPNGDRQARQLAALPVKLVAGPVDFGSLPAWTPVCVSMAIAWLCVLLAGVAVAVLLHGAVSLSERRGAFVSAVTHELRTPLTTFKMYSEMLAEGMVPDEAKRRHYLGTLCSEANRLSHLVENVLAYARLERGSARSRVEKLSLGDLIKRVKPRLVQRAEQAGMTLVEDADAPALKTVVHVDVAAVEQILFNLVDNACKYAAPTATEKLIHLEALPDGRFAMLRVRDHGQGISAEGARRLFRPFSKSAHEAAHTAPGVGLGLALCRRLSRSMGGDLRLAAGGGGACFELLLPLGQLPAGAATLG
jgi:signal transduction histidine kinase